MNMAVLRPWRVAGPWERSRWPWGVAWRRYDVQRIVLMPVPLCLVARLVRWVWFGLAYELVSCSGYDRAWESGHRAATDRMMEDLETERRRLRKAMKFLEGVCERANMGSRDYRDMETLVMDAGWPSRDA